MNKTFVLTNHAQQVTQERRIDVEWIEGVIRSPQRVERDKTDANLSHYLGKIPERGGRVLRVVLNSKATPKRVVTAYFDRSLRSKL